MVSVLGCDEWTIGTVVPAKARIMNSASIAMDYKPTALLVEWLQAKHVLCVAVDASLRASYGYTCPACMPQVAHEEQEPQAEVGS